MSSPRSVLSASMAAGLLTLTACGGGGDGSAPATTSGAWSWSNGAGLTTELDARPDTVVVDAYSAAALWPYGVRPDAVFGYGLEEGASSLALGDADPDEMDVVGRGGELDIEALAAAGPDLIVGYGSDETDWTQWTWWDDDVAGKVESIAPFAGVAFQEDVADVIGQYASLAEALGADVHGAEVVQAEKDFDAAAARLREVVAAEPDLTVLPLNAAGLASGAYVGNEALAQMRLLTDLGVTLAGPDGEAGEAWPEISWEVVDDYPADVVLEYVGSKGEFADAPTYQALPAVKAGQVADWDDKRPSTYASYATWLDEVADAYEAADDVA
ncbi:MAG: ABC transporter substrate-binding protein [Nocardioidaceae bacterium]|nr:ABC transporter substrate-binding protein [Nocardioidaceae bacterium]